MFFQTGKRHRLRKRIYGNASRPRRRPTRSSQYFFEPKTRRSRLDDTVDTKEGEGNEEEEDTEENGQENKENDQQRVKAKKEGDGEKKVVAKRDLDEKQEREEEEEEKDKNGTLSNYFLLYFSHSHVIGIF